MIDVQRLPRHVAIIMDGNGRWAERAGLPRPEGHRQGAEAVKRIVRSCRRLGVQALTLYAFSEQNWLRPPMEVTTLMKLLKQFLTSEREELIAKEIRLRAIGRVGRLPKYVRDVLVPITEETSTFQGMTLTLALSYGGREEIVDAARLLATEVKQGKRSPESINVSQFESALDSSVSGPVDLLIRTGGEQRISNFLLWSSAYAELVFSPKYWPDYEESDLFAAIADYQQRERRFGRVSTGSQNVPSQNVAEQPSSSGLVDGSEEAKAKDRLILSRTVTPATL